MRRILYLAKILRKSGAGGSSAGGDKSRTVNFWIIFGIVISAGLVFCATRADLALAVIGDIGNLCTIMFFFAAVIGLFISLPGIINSLYLSNDLQVLMTLPYKPMEILAAKVINATDLLWGISFVFTVPFGFTYGFMHNAGPVYFLAVFLAFICIPVIVVSAVGIIIMILMYFTTALRNKDVINIIVAVLMFIFAAGCALVINLGRESTGGFLEMIGNMTSYSDILPVNAALGELLNEGSLKYVPEVLIITAAFAGVFSLLAWKIYIPGALSVQETASSGGMLTDYELSKKIRQRSQFAAYLMKDLRHVRRNPAYLMQGFLYTIIYPGVMLVIMVGISGGTNTLSLSGIDSDAAVVGWVTAVCLIVSIVCSATNVIASSCMSREGNDIMILKQSPVDHRIVLRAKLYAAYIVCMLGSVTYVIGGGTILAILGFIPWWSIFYGLVLTLFTLYFSVSFCMMKDIKKPSFTWESEEEMLKKRTGAGSIVLLIIGILVPVMLGAVIRLSGDCCYIAMIVITVIMGLIALIETKRMFRTGIAKMRKY